MDQYINLNLKHGHFLFLDHGLMKILCLGLITGHGVNVGAKIYDFENKYFFAHEILVTVMGVVIVIVTVSDVVAFRVMVKVIIIVMVMVNVIIMRTITVSLLE